MHSMLLTLAAVMASVSAMTVNLPLYSRAVEAAAQGSTRFRLPVSRRQSDSSGVNVPVTDWFSRTDNQWYTTFSIGTPPQDLTAFFDTATPLFIIPSSNCSSCTKLTLFDPDKSSTFSSLPGTEKHPIFTSGVDSIPLAQPEAPQCKLVHDTVSLNFGQLKVNMQSITLCDTYTDALEKSTISGVMGMGIGDPSLNDNSWFSNLVDGAQVDSAVFSFYIPPGNLAGGQVTLGGVDESKVDGDIRWTNLSADSTPEIFTYILDQSAIYAGGNIIYRNSTNGSEAFAGYALLDTGTAFMQAPDFDTAKSIYSQISPDITQIDPAGAWGAPCDKMDSIAPDLTFTLGTNDEALNLTIPSKYFNLGEYPGQPGICQALFNNPTKGSEMALDGVGVWIAGSPLLNKYYTVWDVASLRIGWGKLAGQSGLTATTDDLTDEDLVA